MSGGADTHSDVELDVGRRAWPVTGLERVLVCPVCGCDRRSPVYRNLTDRVFFCAPGSWDMHRCEQCGSHYLDPRPDPRTVHLAYARYFTHAEASSAAAQAARSGLEKLRRSCANGYRNWRYGTHDRPATALGVAVALLFPRLRHMADVGMRYLPRASSGRRLLDVGAGNGAFLLQARSAGWEVVGIEPDSAAVEAARLAGLDVRPGGIQCLANEPESVDVITINHVIEHVHDPRAVLSEAFRLLRSGGVLYLDTPNVDSYGHRRFGCHWRGLEPPRHLVLFSWNSLERLLGEVGFGDVKRLPRPGVYPALSAKSRAIARGTDPETIPKSPPLVGALDALSEMRTLFNYRRREYITLLAVKR